MLPSLVLTDQEDDYLDLPSKKKQATGPNNSTQALVRPGQRRTASGSKLLKATDFGTFTKYMDIDEAKNIALRVGGIPPELK